MKRALITVAQLAGVYVTFRLIFWADDRAHWAKFPIAIVLAVVALVAIHRANVKHWAPPE